MAFRTPPGWPEPPAGWRPPPGWALAGREVGVEVETRRGAGYLINLRDLEGAVGKRVCRDPVLDQGGAGAQVTHDLEQLHHVRVVAIGGSERLIFAVRAAHDRDLAQS
jgi:hypothetical protein